MAFLKFLSIGGVFLSSRTFAAETETKYIGEKSQCALNDAYWSHGVSWEVIEFGIILINISSGSSKSFKVHCTPFNGRFGVIIYFYIVRYVKV